MKEFLLDKFLLENNKGIEGIESFSDCLSIVSYDGWWWRGSLWSLEVPKWNASCWKEQFLENCALHSSHNPFVWSVSLPKMSLGAICWKAGAMCSFRPLMSWPLGMSLAIFWASLSCLVRGLSPVAITNVANLVLQCTIHFHSSDNLTT